MKYRTVRKQTIFLECSTTLTESIDVNEIAKLTVLSRNDTVIEHGAGILKAERRAALCHLNKTLKPRVAQWTKKPGFNYPAKLTWSRQRRFTNGTPHHDVDIPQTEARFNYRWTDHLQHIQDLLKAGEEVARPRTVSRRLYADATCFYIHVPRLVYSS